MGKIMTLGGAESGLGADRCKCVRNSRTGRSVRLCFVGKSKKTRSGWQFMPGSCQPPRK